jgi:hypothetical protein
MTTIPKSALEAAVLDRFHKLYQAQGFPPAESIGVLRRQNTGGGRYVDLECDTPVRLDDGYVDLGGSFIEMKGVPNGMMAVVLVKNGRVNTLEFTVYGGDFWSGEESAWRLA